MPTGRSQHKKLLIDLSLNKQILQEVQKWELSKFAVLIPVFGNHKDLVILKSILKNSQIFCASYIFHYIDFF